MPDLLGAFHEATALLPDVADDRMIVLDGSLIPPPLSVVDSDRLVLRGMSPGHIYDSYRCDSVEFYADEPTYRALALLVFATVFHGCSCVVRLGDAGRVASDAWLSPITSLIVDGTFAARATPDPSELVEKPVAYGYRPEPVDDINPLYDRAVGPRRVQERELPSVSWTNEDEMPITDEGWRMRSVVRGFGHPVGATRFAALLLDLALPESRRDNCIRLEGPAGFQSVTATSAEVRLRVGYESY